MIKIVEQETGQANVDWINRDAARREFDTPVPPAPIHKAITTTEAKGDVSGHAFHGNRFTGGIGGGEKQSGLGHPPTGEALQQSVRDSVIAFDKVAEMEIESETHRNPHMYSYPAEKLKDEVAYNIKAKSGLSYERSTEMVKTWARSSSDSKPDSVALQVAASQRFGINPGAYIEGQAKYLSGGYRAAVEAGPPAPRTDVDSQGRLLMGQDDIEGSTDPAYNEKWNASYKAFTDAVGASMQMDKTTSFVIPAAYAVEHQSNPNGDFGIRSYAVRPFPGFGTSVYTPRDGFKQTVLENGDVQFTRDNTTRTSMETTILEGTETEPRAAEDQPHSWDERVGDAQKVVEAIYSHTQDVLRSMGITEMTVFRGMNWYHPNVIPDALLDKTEVTRYDSHGNEVRGIDEDNPSVRLGRYPVEMDLNPISSFSVNVKDALEFGAGDRGIVLGATVRADRIFSLASTGLGCLHEGEVVVIGGPSDLFGGPGYPVSTASAGSIHGEPINTGLFKQSGYHGA